jgi:hypothetical protein
MSFRAEVVKKAPARLRARPRRAACRVQRRRGQGRR